MAKTPNLIHKLKVFHYYAKVLLSINLICMFVDAIEEIPIPFERLKVPWMDR